MSDAPLDPPRPDTSGRRGWLGLVAAAVVVAGATTAAVLVITADEAATPPATTVPAETAEPDATTTTEATTTTTVDDGTVSVFELEVGTCFDAPADDDEVARVPVVDCDEPHDFEVYFVGAIAAPEDGAFPGDDEVAETARDLCLEPFAEFVGRAWVDSTIDYRWLAPTAGSWDEGDREVVCFVSDPEGPVTGTLAGADR